MKTGWLREPRVTRVLLLAVTLLAAAPAWSQLGGHGMPRPGRPLHVRLALADVVAIADVDRVDLGRIAVRDARTLRGETDDGFLIKRAPSRAPDLMASDRVLFLLRGAREPYVLVDEPRELMRLPDEEATTRWRDALAELLAAPHPEEVRDVYLAWVDGSDDELRAAATRALADRREHPLPMTPEIARERARIALDSARPLAVRRASAAVACGDPSGTRALLAGVGARGVDPGVVQLALATGTMQRIEGVEGSVARALRSQDRGVVRAALPAAGAVAGDPRVRSELERIAGDDSDAKLAQGARRALGRRRPSS